MIRHLILVLLLATSVAFAEGKADTQPAAGNAEAQANADENAQPPIDPDVQAQPEMVAKATTGGSEKPESGDAQVATDKDAKQPADGAAQAPTDKDGKLVSVPGSKALGMSILGNQEAPKSLTIVPWKSSEVGRSPGTSPMLDDSRQPVDKEVFMRALSYYEIRSESKH
jgi:hypothetical protein